MLDNDDLNDSYSIINISCGSLGHKTTQIKNHKHVVYVKGFQNRGSRDAWGFREKFREK